MLCPEGAQLQTENTVKDEEDTFGKKAKVPEEGNGSLELNSYKNPKNWKKSLTNFFRNQIRSTKSNDGERPSGNEDNFEEKEITTDQKWQSLGKVFRRQSFGEHWQKSPKQQGESSSQNKRTGVRKIISSYFGIPPKNSADNKNREN